MGYFGLKPKMGREEDFFGMEENVEELKVKEESAIAENGRITLVRDFEVRGGRSREDSSQRFEQYSEELSTIWRCLRRSAKGTESQIQFLRYAAVKLLRIR